jgi:hypothetical protein
MGSKRPWMKLKLKKISSCPLFLAMVKKRNRENIEKKNQKKSKEKEEIKSY